MKWIVRYATWIAFTGIFFLLFSGPVSQAREMTDEMQRLLIGFTWYKQSAFRIQDGETVLYIDPYQLAVHTNDADVILISHPHGDHSDTASIRGIVKESTVLYSEPSTANKYKRIVSTIQPVAPGDRIDIHGITIEMVPAYNINKSFHPQANLWLGFIVTLSDGRRLYHAGDTDKIPEMDQLDVDIALLPVGGTFTMTAVEAVEAAKAIQPKLVVPMHYGSAVGSVRDAERVQQNLEGIIPVAIFDPGQSIEPLPTLVPHWREKN